MKKIKKLSLKKESITNLNSEDMNTLRGGDVSVNTCQGYCEGPTATSANAASNCVCTGGGGGGGNYNGSGGSGATRTCASPGISYNTYCP